MMYISKSRYLTRGEVWFDDDPGDMRSVDWIVYHQRSRPAPGSKWRYFYTYVVDLAQSTETLLSRLGPNTAYKIRRARERDRIICERCDSSDPIVLDRLEEMYDLFAAAKGLGPLDRAQLDSIAANGALDLSVAKDPQGNALVYHADYRDQRRARGLYLPSLYRNLSDSAARNLIGRANRYLTWSDLLRYKDAGLTCYDFGGWYHGTDPGMLKINEFKSGFGGQVLREYECEQILTLKAWVVLHVAKLLKQAKLLRSGPNRAPNWAPTETQQPEAVPSA